MALDVDGFTVMDVSGVGEYKNYFKDGCEVKHIRLELYLQESRASEVAETIVEAAHTGNRGDGIVALKPVNEIYRIRTREKCHMDESC